jgi:type IV fimbrial biogenesis protein FimT
MKRFRTQSLRDSKAIKGFTLIELMFTLAVAAVIIGIAAPNMRTFILNNRISSSANELLRSIQTARTEAPKRQQFVVVCMTADASTCTTSNYTGWIVFEDTNKDWVRQTSEPILDSHTFDSNKIKILADGDKTISFAVTGFANPTGAKTPSRAIVVCDSRGIVDSSGGTTGLSVARGIVISKPGHARITRTISSSADSADLTELYSATGGSC